MKLTAVPFTDKLPNEKPSAVMHVKIWVDGPPSQIKKHLWWHWWKCCQKKYNVRLSWNFCVTSEDKDLVDGVGATLKRHAVEKVQTRKVTINIADEFYQAARDSNIKVTLTNTTELQKYSNRYLETLFSKSSPIPGLTAFFILFNPLKVGTLQKDIHRKLLH